jgi:hypothetical protein
MTDSPVPSFLDRIAHQMRVPALPNFPVAANPLVSYAEKNLASEFYRRLTRWIANFDSTLDAEHEVGVRLVSFGNSEVFHLQDLKFWNPSLLWGFR